MSQRGAIRRGDRSSSFVGQAIQLLAVLILVFAPALDAAARPAGEGNQSAKGAQLLPAWLDVVDDPLDHPEGQLPSGHCNQTQLAKFLPASEQTFLKTTVAAFRWEAVFTMPVPQVFRNSLDRPPRY